jgi:hypothetical protein
MFGCTIGLLLFQHINRLILEQVFVGFYSSIRINLFQNRIFFHLEEALYRSTSNSLGSMPAYVIEFMFFASLDCVMLFNLCSLP